MLLCKYGRILLKYALINPNTEPEVVLATKQRLIGVVRGEERTLLTEVEAKKLLLKVSQFVERTPEITELDINPIFVYSDDAVAVDARMILEEEW